MDTRRLIEIGLEEKNRDLVELAVNYAMVNDEPIHEWIDLHFRTMLLLAAPRVKKKRGRPKSTTKDQNEWLLALGCMVKSSIDGKSFTEVWDEFLSYKTRPVMPDIELWRAASIVHLAMTRPENLNGNLTRTFNLKVVDVERVKVSNENSS